MTHSFIRLAAVETRGDPQPRSCLHAFHLNPGDPALISGGPDATPMWWRPCATNGSERAVARAVSDQGQDLLQETSAPRTQPFSLELIKHKLPHPSS